MVVIQTPLRVSLFGGGTDFPEYFLTSGGGGVLTMSIDKFVYVVAKRRFDSAVRVSYSRTEVVSDAAELENDLVRECMLEVGLRSGIEIALLADVPSQGTGLGSSGSFIVGILHALYRLQGIRPSARLLAEKACSIERERLGRSVGLQDQYIAAFGGIRQIAFGRSGITVEHVSEVPPERLDDLFWLVYTGKTRSASDVLAEQAARIGETRDLLDAMAEQVSVGRRHLESADLESLGRLITEGWGLKRRLATTITHPEIDDLCRVVDQAGALGHKLCGAGGGGFVLALVPPAARKRFLAQMADRTHFPLRVTPFGSRSLVSIGDLSGNGHLDAAALQAAPVDVQ